MTHQEAIRRNVFYSVLDYASQPALMLVATPFLLRGLGVQQYGTWMLVNSIAAVATGIGGGFGDGATKYVATYRGMGDRAGAVRALTAVLAVHSAFGLVSALTMVYLAPWLIEHVFSVEAELRTVAIAAVRISAALLVLRFVESVFVAAIRGCESYRPTVWISTSGRVLLTAVSVTLALRDHSLIAILWATLIIAASSLAAQAVLAYVVLQVGACWRTIELMAGLREVFSFGAFTWIKSSLGVVVAYADRLLVAGVLGTGPLAYYALCNQLTQPFPALLAAAFNFIFPHFSSQSGSAGSHHIQRLYRNANIVVLALAAFAGIFLVAAANPILRWWIGPSVAAQYHSLLRLVAIGNCLLALSVVPQYAALAFGRARAMAVINFFAGALALPTSYFLMLRAGVIGAGLGKIIAGVVFLSAFAIARRAMHSQATSAQNSPETTHSKTTFGFAR